MEIIYSPSGWEEEEEHINRAFPKAKVNNQPVMIHMMTFVELMADVNARCRIKQATAGKTTRGRLTRGQCLRAISGLSQRLDSSAVGEMSHTGN